MEFSLNNIHGSWVLSQLKKFQLLEPEVSRLSTAGFPEKAEALSFSVADQYGHPGTYSMTSPHENFAEALTHILIDPSRMKTASPEIWEFFNKLLFRFKLRFF